MISSAWIWFITCALAFAAERRSASRIRIDSTAPSPVFGIAVSVFGEHGDSSLVRVERVGLASTPPGLPVLPCDFDDGQPRGVQRA